MISRTSKIWSNGASAGEVLCSTMSENEAHFLFSWSRLLVVSPKCMQRLYFEDIAAFMLHEHYHTSIRYHVFAPGHIFLSHVLCFVFFR